MSISLKVAVPCSKVVAALAAFLALTGAGACEPQTPDGGAEIVTRSATASASKVDILFMVDNSSSMTSIQQKMLAQIPMFVESLQSLPNGLPDIHLAVVSSDMGAPSDAEIGCSLAGDGGNFFSQPEAPCVATGLAMGATFITDDATGATKNFAAADPAGLAAVFQCIALLGSSGCGFEHQLASVARALGADGRPAPAVNVGFLRDDAELAIVLLTNEDDCSAPPAASALPVYSLNGDSTNDINTPAYPGGPPEGPIANYRCNGGPLGGHLCDDPTGSTPTTLEQPPLNPPTDATGNPQTLAMTNCESNDTSSSALLPVSSLIAGIKALKDQPDSDIVVGAIMAPATPYVVEWVPGSGTSGSQRWPQVEHSCQNAIDQSFGDPPVRIAKFVQAFGDNGVTESICDGSYAAAFQLIASKIAAHLPGASTGAGGLDGGSGLGGNAGTRGASDAGGAGVTGTGGTTGAGGTPGTGSAGTTGAGGIPGTGSAGTMGAGGIPGTGSAGTTGAGGTPGTGSAGTTGTGGIPGTGSAGTTGAGAGPTTGAGAGPGGTPGTGSAGTVGAGRMPDAGENLGKGGGCSETGGGPPSAWSVTMLLAMLFARRARSRPGDLGRCSRELGPALLAEIQQSSDLLG